MPSSRSSPDSLAAPSRMSAGKTSRRLERLLRLGRGELRPGLLLFAYLFLVIGAATAGRAVRDGLFLARFGAVRLPLADLAAVAGVMATASAYLRLGRAASLRNLLVGSLLAFGFAGVAFWWLAHAYSRSAWLAPALYIWVGIVGAVAPTQVWTLANYVLTLRQAKRLIGFVGAGSILGGIAGGATGTLLTRRFGSGSVLLAMALALTACALIVPAICRCASAVARGDSRGPNRAVAAAGGVRSAAEIVLRSPYLRLIGLLVALTALTATISSWQFKTIARASYSGPDELTAFFASFIFFANLTALAVQILLTRSLVRRVGLGVALSIVPVALAAGSVGLLALGSLAAVVFLKGSDQVLRFSIDRSASELLYLPVPRTQTFQVKSLLSTVVGPLGDALGSLVILLFAWALGLTPKQVPPGLASQLSWLTLALCAAWLAAASSMHRQYLRNLSDALRQNRVDVQGVTVLDRATTELLASNLGKGESRRVLSALSVVEASRVPSLLPKVEQLMSHPSAAVRARALAVLSISRTRKPPAGIEALLFDPDLRVRSAALLYMSRAGLDPLERLQKAGDFEDLSVRSSMVVYLSRPGRTQNLEACRELLDAMIRERGPQGTKARVEAARLLASLPNAFKDQVARLLADDDADVVRHAIRAVGRVRASRFVPELIHALDDAETAADAGGALARFGHRIVPVLAASLADPSAASKLRQEVAKVLARIASPSAEQALIDNLAIPEVSVRFQVVSSLNLLKRRHPEPAVDPTIVDRALMAELTARYGRYLPSLDAFHESASSDPEDPQLECIFRLLQLLLPGRDINSAYVGIQSADPVVHDKALEFLDNVLSPHLRKILVPLIDSKVEREERAAIAARLCVNA